MFLKRQIESANALKRSEAELQEKSRLLIEKNEQVRDALRSAHKTEIIENANDIVNKIIIASDGPCKTLDWSSLTSAVDSLYPEFYMSVIKEFGVLQEQELRVCYLMRIGLSNRQIQNLTDMSRTTLWRWTNRFSAIHEIK